MEDGQYWWIDWQYWISSIRYISGILSFKLKLKFKIDSSAYEKKIKNWVDWKTERQLEIVTSNPWESQLAESDGNDGNVSI